MKKTTELCRAGNRCQPNQAPLSCISRFSIFFFVGKSSCSSHSQYTTFRNSDPFTSPLKNLGKFGSYIILVAVTLKLYKTFPNLSDTKSKFGSKMGGTQVEREEKVSLELSEEILQSMEIGMTFKDYNGRISSLDFHRASSYLVTASDDESIRLYDVSSGTCLKTINSKKYGVDLVCFTSHPTTVIYSSKNGWDESLRLLSLHDNKYLRYFKGHHDRVVSLSLCSRKDCFISGSLDRTVLLWDQRAEKCQGLLHVQGRPAISYDDQGLVFAIAFGGYIRMFDARNYEKGPFEIFSVGGDISDANVVKFSNDGRLMLLTTADGHIHVLDSFRGTLLSTYNVTPVSCNSTLEASFSPEGMFVISGSGHGSIYAWSVRSGKEVACWRSATSDTGPPVIKWAPGNLMFATGSSELSFWVPDLSKLGSYVGRK